MASGWKKARWTGAVLVLISCLAGVFLLTSQASKTPDKFPPRKPMVAEKTPRLTPAQKQSRLSPSGDDDPRVVMMVLPPPPARPSSSQEKPVAPKARAKIAPKIVPKTVPNIVPKFAPLEPHPPAPKIQKKVVKVLVPLAPPPKRPPPAPVNIHKPEKQLVAATERPTARKRVNLSLKAPDVAAGRVLLRIMEHGKGPSVEIAWPDGAGSRQKLYHRFSACYGMRMALLDRQGQLFVAVGARGRPWPINADLYSGYVRSVGGMPTGEEVLDLRAIRDHHRTLLVGNPVRLFPRNIDAQLLGGLKSMVGRAYGAAKSIRAHYMLFGGGVGIERVVVDGRSIPGRFRLRPVKRYCRT